MHHLIIRVWGIVYLMQGPSRTSELINEIMLHTFFVIQPDCYAFYMEAIYHIITDLKCKVLHYGTMVATATPGEDVSVSLKKGRHLLSFISTENEKDSYQVEFEVPENDIEDYIEVILCPYKEKRIAEEQRKREEEQRKIEEQRKREEEQRKRDEERRKREEKLKRMWATEEVGNRIIFYKDDIQFTMVHVAGGLFKMGNDAPSPYGDNTPSHNVQLSDYYIGESVVSRAVYAKIKRWGDITDPDKPLCDSWNDCVSFLRELYEVTGMWFRFPSEAEWEYAAHRKDYYNLHMQEGFFEWCGDVYSPSYYKDSPSTDPLGPESGRYRVYRGLTTRRCLDPLAMRFFAVPKDSFNNLGLRLCLVK